MTTVLASLLATLPALTAGQAPGDPRADLLLVVDCLLPGQVRTLGQRTTYVSARRPARLPARDCQIRGGEYVAYDRADRKSALGAWLPLAEQGDLEAQVIVGEIYERGIGVAADYAGALAWYRRAADAGNRRAMVNLGFLHERGLGVPADAAAALDWYRRAAGRETAIELDPAVQPPPVAQAPAAADSGENERLRARAQELEASLAKLGAELADARAEIADAESRALAAAAGKASARAEAATARADADAARAKAEAARADADRARRELAALPPPAPDRTAEIGALQQELARRSDDATRLAAELDAARRENRARQQELATASQESAAVRSAAESERQQLDAAAKRLDQRDAELAAQRTETERLGRELAAAVALADARQEEIRRLEQPIAAKLVAGPEVALVMPELTPTRDIVPVARAAGAEARVVGRVTAAAGLVAVTVNDRPVATNELGVFDLTLPVAAGDTPVTIVAVDRQGKKGEARFLLRGETATPAAPPAAKNARALAASVDFGAYHALIIGNNDYRYLPDLGSPVNDATDLAALLEKRYGFTTTVLLNADRYQVLSALNALREKLTPHDNLLIYFAGHGELDEVNQRGHWLPVDAERDSTANWIPTTAITDILNIMRAKQVLLVVDSCYAGALTRSSVGRLGAGMTAEERLHWFKTMANRRSRTVLTSGGLAPVMDAGGGRHSVFAKAFLEVLESNDDALDGQRLHREVAARVAYAAANLRFDQVPEYAPIRFAGHEAGEFFLIPGS